MAQEKQPLLDEASKQTKIYKGKEKEERSSGGHENTKEEVSFSANGIGPLVANNMVSLEVDKAADNASMSAEPTKPTAGEHTPSQSDSTQHARIPLRLSTLHRYLAAYGLPPLDAIGVGTISFPQLLSSLGMLNLLRLGTDEVVKGTENLLWSPIIFGCLGVLAIGLMENQVYLKPDTEEKSASRSPLPIIAGSIGAVTEGIIFFTNAAVTANQYGYKLSEYPLLMSVAIVFAAAVGGQFGLLDVKELRRWAQHGHQYLDYDELFKDQPFKRWLVKFAVYIVPLVSALCFTALGASETYQLTQAICALVFDLTTANRAAWPLTIPFGSIYGLCRYALYGAKWIAWINLLCLKSMPKEVEEVQQSTRKALQDKGYHTEKEKLDFNHLGRYKPEIDEKIELEEKTMEQREKEMEAEIRADKLKRYVRPLAWIAGLIGVPALFFVISTGALAETTFILRHSFSPPTGANEEDTEADFQLAWWVIACFGVASLAPALENFAAEGWLLIASCHSLAKRTYEECWEEKVTERAEEFAKKKTHKVYWDLAHTFSLTSIMALMFASGFITRWGMSTHEHYLVLERDIYSSALLLFLSTTVTSIYLLARHPKRYQTAETLTPASDAAMLQKALSDALGYKIDWELQGVSQGAESADFLGALALALQRHHQDKGYTKDSLSERYAKYDESQPTQDEETKEEITEEIKPKKMVLGNPHVEGPILCEMIEDLQVGFYLVELPWNLENIKQDPTHTVTVLHITAKRTKSVPYDDKKLAGYQDKKIPVLVKYHVNNQEAYFVRWPLTPEKQATQDATASAPGKPMPVEETTPPGPLLQVIPARYGKVATLAMVGGIATVLLLQGGVNLSRHVLLSGAEEDNNEANQFAASEALGSIFYGIGAAAACSITSHVMSKIKAYEYPAIGRFFKRCLPERWAGTNNLRVGIDPGL